MNRFLSMEQSIRLLEQLKVSGIAYTYDFQKHRITITEGQAAAESKEGLVFRMPLTIPPPLQVDELNDRPVHFVMLLIQSGSAALGNFKGREILDHKVTRAYMVRKKQGKSQIKYLKTKGKSRAGSRVRLAGTVEFFENINQRLQRYFADDSIDRIAISCSKTLIPYLFSAKVAPPFTKKDERLYKVPKHVHTPTFDVLMDVHKFLSNGELLFEEEQAPLVYSLLGR